ncbi:MAG: hypothetical protein IH926_10695, partial [Proteobacteria bacterium]|nr:hypothetical protein [Pseudomonadota bacterium]
GAGTTNVTDFDLIFDLLAADLDDPDNVFLTLLDQGNIQLGDQGSGVDGAIWLIEFDPVLSDFVVSDPILYDLALDVAIADSSFIGDLVIFDSDTPHVNFDLDFGLLTTAGNVTDPELTTFSTLDEFGNVIAVEIEAIDISGSHSDEENTLTLSAQDVIDATEEIEGDYQLIVLGDDNDTLVLEDGSNWTLVASDTTDQVSGSSETFDLYVADFGDTMVTLLVDSDLAVQLETAMA